MNPKLKIFKLFYIFLVLMTFFSCKKNKIEEVVPPPVESVYTPIKLESSSFTLGNLEKKVDDSFLLKFNKPVKINYIKYLSKVCLAGLKWHQVENGTLIKFYNFYCANLGEDPQFEFSVKDEEGKILLDTVSFSYYTRRLAVTGSIIDFMITPDNKYCWVSTNEPNQIYCLGLEDTSYIRKYAVDFQPSKIVLNPFNHKLYILNYFAYANNTDKIYVMDPGNGNIEKTITVAKDKYDDSLYAISVYQLEFGYNGYGIIITGTIRSGPYRWRILDSRTNDSISIHPAWIASLSSSGRTFNEFVNCQANYNKTKIYLREPYSMPEMGVLDCNTKTITEEKYYSSFPNHYIVPSKTQDKLFIAGYLYQGILTGGNSYGNHSELDNRYSETADFSYRDKEQDVIYYRNRDDNYQLLILDYKNLKILSKINVRPDFNKITSTTNGKYILALSGNALFIYNTDMFYKY